MDVSRTGSRLSRSVGEDAGSFYARFRNMCETDAALFARQVWAGINLPNLREHIAPLKQQADILVEKSADHALRISLPALASRT
jgi:type I pantothenate kinase